MLRLHLGLTLAALLSAAPAVAQVHPGQPEASRSALLAPVPTVAVQAPDHQFLKDQERTAPPGPLRYGVVLPLVANVTQVGSIEITPDEMLVFRVEVSSPRAFSLGLEFSQWDMPASGKLFLYDKDLHTVFGAYDASNRIEPSGEMVIEPFPGDSLIVEYSQPLAETKLGQVEIRAVIHDYRDVFRMERELDNEIQTKGGCSFVDVNCPEGNPFPLQKRATVRTMTGGGLCSASLINNTANDGTRYVYTANHCGQGSTTVFRFNYQTSGCATGSAPTTQNVSGATLLANDVDTDGRLLRINNAIPAGYQPYFAGWSRSTSNLTFGLSMNHPGGGVKKIAIDNNGGGQQTVSVGGIGAVKCWSMNFQIGGLAGGSSGGPLFDQNNRIRGTATAVASDCSIGFYGRFFSFWNESPIAQFLDPTASGVTQIDGFDPSGGPPPAAPVITTVNPSSVNAFGSPIVTLTGTGFTGSTAVNVGGTVLTTPFGFTVANDTTITFTPPPPSALGAVNVTVTNANGTSPAKTLTYVETQPLALAGPIFMINGQNATWNWGGKANQTQFFNFAVTNQTVPYLGQPFLLYLGSIGLGSTGPIGLGTVTAPISGLPVGMVLYVQIMTAAGGNPQSVQLSNIVGSQVLG